MKPAVRRFAIFATSALLAFLLSSCTTKVCMRSHTERVAAQDSVTMIPNGMGGFIYSSDHIPEHDMEVCDAYETRESNCIGYNWGCK